VTQEAIECNKTLKEIEQYMETETYIKQMYKNYTSLDALGSKEQ